MRGFPIQLPRDVLRYAVQAVCFTDTAFERCCHLLSCASSIHYRCIVHIIVMTSSRKVPAYLYACFVCTGVIWLTVICAFAVLCFMPHQPLWHCRRCISFASTPLVQSQDWMLLFIVVDSHSAIVPVDRSAHVLGT